MFKRVVQVFVVVLLLPGFILASFELLRMMLSIIR